jgi:mRNA-degrading endonuclease RelE of RelBE toxin-antitoxin system
MPKIRLSKRFTKAYLRLPIDIREKVKKALVLLAENPRHPSLQTKPIKGAPGFYEARIDIKYRMTYIRLEDDTLEMSYVASHDDALKHP